MYEIPGFTRSYEAAGDLTTSHLKFVKLTGSIISAVTAATDNAIGVLRNKPNAAGVAGTVMIDGVSMVKAAGALAAGIPVYPAADGSVTGVVVAGHCVGITETSCSAAGQVVAVNIKPLGAIGSEI